MNVLKIFGLLMITSVLGLAFTNPTPTTNYKVNLSKSNILWKGYKVTGSHEGTLALKSGSLEYAEDKLIGGNFEIDMNTLTCTDLEGKGKGKLEGHLKSADFFGVSDYPTARFEITKVVSRGTPGDYKIVGNLTLKENTKEIKFLTKIPDPLLCKAGRTRGSRTSRCSCSAVAHSTSVIVLNSTFSN